MTMIIDLLNSTPESMSDVSSSDSSTNKYQQLPNNYPSDKNIMLIPESQLLQLRTMLYDRPHSFSNNINKQVNVADYIHELKRLNSDTYWYSPDIQALAEQRNDDKVSYIDKQVRHILLHQEYDCFSSQQELQHFLSSLSEELGKLVAQVTHQRSNYKEMIPFTKVLKDMVEHNQQFALEVSQNEKIQSILRCVILDMNIHNLIRYQFAEVISRLLRIDVINKKFPDDSIIALAHALRMNIDRYCSGSLTMNMVSGEHVSERLVSMHLLSIYLLCKTRRFQVLTRILFTRLSFIAETIHNVLSNFASSNTRQMCLLIMDQILNSDFAPLFANMKLSYSLVQLLGNTYPEVIYLAGRLLLRVWAECNLEEKEKQETIRGAVITLFCKNVIAQPTPNGLHPHNDPFFTSTCQTLYAIVNYSEYAKKELYSLLNDNIKIDKTDLVNPVEDMKQMRKLAIGNRESFRNLVEIYERTVLVPFSNIRERL